MHLKSNIVLLALLLSACERGLLPAGPATPPPVSTPPALQAPQSIPAFTLTPPEHWSGRYRVETVAGEQAEGIVPKARQIVEYLYLPVSTALGEQPLFMVIVMALEDWRLLNQQDGPPLGELLAEHHEHAFIVSLPQSNPYGMKSEDGQRFEQMHLDLEGIRRSFTLGANSQPSAGQVRDS